MAEQGLEYLLANSPFGGLEDMISGNYISPEISLS